MREAAVAGVWVVAVMMRTPPNRRARDFARPKAHASPAAAPCIYDLVWWWCVVRKRDHSTKQTLANTKNRARARHKKQWLPISFFLHPQNHPHSIHPTPYIHTHSHGGRTTASHGCALLCRRRWMERSFCLLGCGQAACVSLFQPPLARSPLTTLH